MEKIETNYINENRYYKIVSKDVSNYYPSVTSITKIHFQKILNKWLLNKGEEVVNNEKRIALDRGIKTHWFIENFLKTNILPSSQDSDDSLLFNYMLPELKKINNILKIEETLFSHEYKIAGTVDCIGYYDNKLSIIDFKTSKKKKYKSSCKQYFMQCAAYATCYNEMYCKEDNPEKIENLVLIIGVDDIKVKCTVLTSELNQHLADFLHYRQLFKNINGY
jgi:hypothetical protein